MTTERPVPAVALLPVTRQNWRDCLALEIAPGQDGFVNPPALSLCECAYEPGLEPLVVEVAGAVVGHMVLRRDGGDGWIHRLLVDRRHQGRGIGRAALLLAIARFRAEQKRAVRIAVLPRNVQATRLYIALGFRETGERLAGDDVLRLDL